MNKSFEDYIKEQNINNQEIIIDIWKKYMLDLKEIYSFAHGDMEQAGILIKNKLKEWKVL